MKRLFVLLLGLSLLAAHLRAAVYTNVLTTTPQNQISNLLQSIVTGSAGIAANAGAGTNNLLINPTNYTMSTFDTNMPGQENLENTPFRTPFWYEYYLGFYHLMSPSGWFMMTVREQGPFLYFGDPHYWDACSFQVKSTEEGGIRPRITFHYGTNETSPLAFAYRLFESDICFGSKLPGNDEINYPIVHHDNHGAIWFGSTNYTALWGSNTVITARRSVIISPFGDTNVNTFPDTVMLGSTTNYFLVQTNRVTIAGPLNILNSGSVGSDFTVMGQLYMFSTLYSLRRSNDYALDLYVNDASTPLVTFTNYVEPDVFTNQGVILRAGQYVGDGGGLTNIWIAEDLWGGWPATAVTAPDTWDYVSANLSPSNLEVPRHQPAPTSGYLSNLVVWMDTPIATTTNVLFTIQTNINLVTSVATPLSCRLAGGTGLTSTNSGTAAWVIGATSGNNLQTMTMHIVPSTSLTSRAVTWKVTWYHPIP